MSLFWKLGIPLLLTSVALWAQSGSAPTAQDSANAPAAQPGQSSPEPATDQPAAKPNAGDSTMLEAIKTEKAEYPLEAREKQLQGQVWVKVKVSEAGDVESVEVISGDPILAKTAVQAAKKWKFKPFIRDGKPVSVYGKLPFNFAFYENVHEVKALPEGNLSTDSDAPKRVRISEGISGGLLVHKVQPVYPNQARWARIQGTVLLRAIISKEGRIVDLKLISGPKELVPAAIGAVQQWRYKPYLLMGQPVEVDTEVQVNFQLYR